MEKITLLSVLCGRQVREVNLTEFVIWGYGDKQFTLLNDCVVWGGRFRKVYLNKCVVWGCSVLVYVLCGKAGMGQFT